MSETAPRLGMPYIRANQSQKEVTHNAALNILDALVLAVAEDRDLSAPPVLPFEGGVWIVGAGASGDWAGETGRLAHFIGGAWAFYDMPDGGRVWLRDEQTELRMSGGSWVAGEIRGASLVLSGLQVVGSQQAAVADASGGTVIDGEARAALNALLAACRSHGLIAS